MIGLLVIGVLASAAAGVYLALSRDVVRCVLGLSVLGAAANLLIFTVGRPHRTAPAIVAAGEALLDASSNPLPQALVLTAIVIGFVLTCFSLVLVLRVVQVSGSDDTDRLRFAEPEPTHPIKPPEDGQ